ncbi:MAG TPA: hypothetical protein VID29_07930 [Solirubrobacteraceae bacterium]|jgi:hypothetical protein
MHSVALHLVPILGAEKSKTPFYIVGGALVVWAFVVSMGAGTRRPDFPSTLGGQRLVIAITALLVLATMGAAVATSGTPSQAAPASSVVTAPAGAGEAPATGATEASPSAPH